MSALDRLVKRLMCTQLKAKLTELQAKLKSTDNDLEKLKIEAMLEVINSVYESECR